MMRYIIILLTGFVVLSAVACQQKQGQNENQKQLQKDQNRTAMENTKKQATLLELEVKGMHCQAGCADGIDKMLGEQEGVVHSKTVYDASASTVQYDKEKISANNIVDLIKERGFEVKVKED